MEDKDFLDDISANFESQLREQHSIQAADLADAEAIEVTLAGRLFASVKQEVDLRLTNGQSLRGEISRAAAEWILLRLTRAEILVWRRALEAISGLSDAPRWPSLVEQRLPATAMLRQFAKTGSKLHFCLQNQDVEGVIVRVGQDFVDVLDHGRSLTLATAAMCYVSCPR